MACSSNGEVATTSGVIERSTTDRPDETTGPQVHLVYVLPSDGTDRHLDTDGTIERSFAAAQKWLAGQIDGRSFRPDTFEGRTDISFLRLSRTDASIQSEEAFAREAIESELQGAGFDATDKLYAVYYDGGSTYACDSGAYPPAIPGNVMVMFLHGTPLNGSIQCGSNDFAADEDSPVFWEFVAVHELLHTLGFVAECAPNEDRFGHVSGPPNDLMFDGDEPPQIDPGHDDYYMHDIERCPDLADSPYLTQ